MTSNDMIALLPYIILALTSVVIMLVIAFHRSHVAVVSLALLGLALAFVSLWVVAPIAPRQVTFLLLVDHYALFFMGLLFAASFAVAVLSHRYLEQHDCDREEFYILLILATLGSAVLVASSHFASFFLGLEILTVSLYGLIAYLRANEINVGAGIKYLILAGVSTAFMLFGIALLYAEFGTMELARLAELVQSQAANAHPGLALLSLSMVIVGIGFKLAVVPFHMWTPDVYEGAPAPVTAYVATVSKGAVFALLLRYFTQMNIRADSSVVLVFTIIAILSMFGGNLLALLQNNVKRLLAYSSIAHLGYLLVAFLAGGALASTAVAFYLAAYFATTLSAFGVITVMSGRQARDTDTLDDYRGLYWRRPWLAGVLTAAMLSLASIPLTAGFAGKFLIVTAGIGSALWLLAISLVASSAIGLYYYLRVIVTMSQRPPEAEQTSAAAPSLSLASGAVLAALTLAVVWLGVYPSPLLDLIQAAVARLI
jgi:NADH-quinone oxidoreductase subunit N